MNDAKERLEHLRAQLRAECISYGELAELQNLADAGEIDPGDLELLEVAGVPEHDPAADTPEATHQTLEEYERTNESRALPLMDANSANPLEASIARARAQDPEYADVDDAGQLSIGVAGEQRSLDGLAQPYSPEEAAKYDERDAFPWLTDEEYAARNA